MSIRQSFKHGIGRLTATAERIPGQFPTTSSSPSSTRLTQVSHKAPVRLVPVWKSSVDQAGAALCALSNYGGGMLQGDSVELHVQVNAHARLGVMTQGASRIYTQRTSNVKNACQATLQATVGPEAILVWAPDPCALFRSSSFHQSQHFTIDPTSSIALIDWFSSGRYRNGEHWAFDQLSSRTSVSFATEQPQDDSSSCNTNHTTINTIPFLQDAMHMDFQAYRKGAMHQDGELHDPLGVGNFHAFASLILYGEHVQEVQQQCQVVSDALLRLYTRVRERPGQEHDDFALEQDDTSNISTNTTTTEFSLKNLGLAGRVCMGISPINLPSSLGSQAHVVRLAATNNEDLYRIFHHCLLPLHTQFGMEFYKERIRAKASEIPRADQQVAGSNQQRLSNQALIVSIHEPAPSESSKMQESMKLGPDTLKHSWLDQEAGTGENSSALWSAFMLADSALPTGSFAHSAGIEVAVQMQLIQSQEQLETFIQAATRSTIQVVAPFLVAGHEWAGKWNGESGLEPSMDATVEEWKCLQQKAQAVLSSNAPACAASLDQGKSLARVGHQWLGNDANLKHNHDKLLLQCFDQHGHHLGPVLGALSSCLGLTTGQVGRLLGYCIARDMVSAAVRLSLVGPLASIKVLRNVQSAADEAWQVFLNRRQECLDGDPLVTAAASAPVLEAIHPCHESLQVRLFRT